MEMDPCKYKDKDAYVSAMMKAYETDPEKIKQFAVNALDQMSAYNRGQMHAIETMIATHKTLNEELAAEVAAFDAFEAAEVAAFEAMASGASGASGASDK